MGVRGIGRRAAGSIATTAGLVSAMVLVAAAFAGDATVVGAATSAARGCVDLASHDGRVRGGDRH